MACSKMLALVPPLWSQILDKFVYQSPNYQRCKDANILIPTSKRFFWVSQVPKVTGGNSTPTPGCPEQIRWCGLACSHSFAINKIEYTIFLRNRASSIIDLSENTRKSDPPSKTDSSVKIIMTVIPKRLEAICRPFFSVWLQQTMHSQIQKWCDEQASQLSYVLEDFQMEAFFDKDRFRFRDHFERIDHLHSVTLHWFQPAAESDFGTRLRNTHVVRLCFVQSKFQHVLPFLSEITLVLSTFFSNSSIQFDTGILETIHRTYFSLTRTNPRAQTIGRCKTGITSGSGSKSRCRAPRGKPRKCPQYVYYKEWFGK